ncbi:MAG: conjugal transfer protein TrbI [Rhodospirillales bacterium 69-11]|jgi:type IV secretion system protein VirB10|nr:MAG: conjugal transfer protein TrbI [Rhodospirillales bacterium 69-11]
MADKNDLSAEAAKTAKADPESLVLRAEPRKVVRFKRRLLIGAAAIGAIAIFGATWFALRGTSLVHHQTDDELYNTDRKRLPDSMAALPSDYGKVKLGSPLPGDLGPSVVDRERSLGVNPTDTSFKPNPEDDAARAERIRLAQQARQASEAGVFFQISNKDVRAALPNMPATANAPPASAGPADTGNLHLDLANDQNNQGHKLSFLNQKDDSGIYNPHTLQEPASPYEVMAGSVIAGSLLGGLNSDLPNDIYAWVTENVYDSVTGQILLIPQGSRLKGHYDSVVAFGQRRALVVWQRIIRPDGSSVEIDNMPAADPSGYAGLEDQVDFHTWALLKGVVMSTLLGVGTQVTFGSNNSDLVEAIRESAAENTNEAGQRIVEKNLNIQPTITIRPGWPLRVLVSKDIILTPCLGVTSCRS